MKKLLIPALMIPMTANAFDFKSVLGFDVIAINKCNSEMYDRMEMDQENEVMIMHLKNGSTMTVHAGSGEMVMEGPPPEISAECKKVYAEMEDSPFYAMSNEEESDTEVEVERDGDRTVVKIKDYEEKKEEEKEEMTSEEKLDLVEKATDVTDSVMKKIGKWFD